MTSPFLELLARSSSVIHFEDGSSLSASDLATTGSAIAGGLHSEYGLEPGDRVAIWLDDAQASLATIAACAAGGFVGVNVNGRYATREAESLIERSGATVVVTARSGDLSIGVNSISPPDLPKAGTGVRLDADGESPFLVFTTSGTTSKPKMVLHRQRSIVDHTVAVAPFFELGPATPVLVALPMCGVFGLNSIAAALAGNCPVWTLDRFDADNAAALVEQESIVAMNGSDDMFLRMMQTGRDVSSLRICGYGAFNAKLDDIVAVADDVDLTLSGVYGMSEVQALFAFRNPREPVGRRREAGGRLASTQSMVRVVDPESGSVLGHGVQGELEIKGPSVFAGYLAEGGAAIDDTLTAAADHDGWFRTGDLGSTSADGTFTFISRMGDVLRLGGFLVDPSEIEEVILGYDGVEDVQVVAGATRAGARPVAFVITADAVAEDRLIEHCRESLARYKCPVRIIEVDRFPVTDGPNGVKIQKARLREMAQAVLDEVVTARSGGSSRQKT